MMRDEILGAFENPGEVADAELPAVSQRGGERQASRIGEGFGLSGQVRSTVRVETPFAESLRPREIQAEEVAAVVGHEVILIIVEMIVDACRFAGWLAD
jgi:hypothetical protein